MVRVSRLGSGRLEFSKNISPQNLQVWIWVCHLFTRMGVKDACSQGNASNILSPTVATAGIFKQEQKYKQMSGQHHHLGLSMTPSCFLQEPRDGSSQFFTQSCSDPFLITPSIVSYGFCPRRCQEPQHSFCGSSTWTSPFLTKVSVPLGFCSCRCHRKADWIQPQETSLHVIWLYKPLKMVE